MALREPLHHHPTKTLAEAAVCFGCAVAALAGAAMALQWIMSLVG